MTCDERLRAAADAVRAVCAAEVRLFEGRLAIEHDLVPNPQKGDLLPARILGPEGFAIWIACDHQTAADRGDAAISPAPERWQDVTLELGDLPSAQWLIAERGPTYLEITASSRNSTARAEVDRILRILREALTC